MPRFEEIHDRFSKGRLSAAEAAEWLGVSERTFRRQRARYEEDGLCGLLDRRLGKVSPHRVPADEGERVLELYRTRYTGWTVKPFHERLVDKHGVTRSYGWTKSVLHAAGLVRPAVKRSAHRKDLVRNNRSNWRVSRHAALLTADIRREALVSYRVLRSGRAGRCRG